MEISQPMSESVWRVGEVERVLRILRDQIGKPYKIGYEDEKTGEWIVRGKPGIDEENPDEFDCSGLSRYVIAQGRKEDGTRIILPHGTRNQIAVCRPVVGEPRPLALGFADMSKPYREVNHVVILENARYVIEARGPQEGRDYGKVIRRPVSKWVAWPGFMGFWYPKGLYPEGVK